MGTIFRLTPSGTFTTLHSFSGTDGVSPNPGLIQGTDGSFYGTTYEGGASDMGTVFRLTPTGTLTTYHSFNGADGLRPMAGLRQGTDGNFYGTTQNGGPSGHGTVFKLTPSGTLTTLHAFTGYDGSEPYAPLIQATDGNLYGTTIQYGNRNLGSNLPYSAGAGTVFKVTPAGAFTTVYVFKGEADGAYPFAGIIQATDGNVYGTTSSGGGWKKYGTVFRLTPSGTLTTLHAFSLSEGGAGWVPILQATDGNLYGVTNRVFYTLIPPPTITATDGIAPQACKWWVTSDNWSTYYVLRDWQACTTALAWTPSLPANYQVGVWARSSGVTVDAPQGSAGLAYEVVPNMLGVYSGSGSYTASACTDPRDNGGAFGYTGHMSISTQNVQTFSGSGNFASNDGTSFTATFVGTVAGAGRVSGAWTVIGSTGTTGTLTIDGTLVGNTVSFTLNGLILVDGGPDTCSLTGSFTGTRP